MPGVFGEYCDIDGQCVQVPYTICTSDWTVVSVYLPTFDDRPAAVEFLTSIDIDIRIDGIPLAEFDMWRTTPVRNYVWKPRPDEVYDEGADAYARGFGGLLPPGSLEVGDHASSLSVTSPQLGVISLNAILRVEDC